MKPRRKKRSEGTFNSGWTGLVRATEGVGAKQRFLEQPGLAFSGPGVHRRRSKNGDWPIDCSRSWFFPNPYWRALFYIIDCLIHNNLPDKGPATGKKRFLERKGQLEKSFSLLAFLSLLFNLLRLSGIPNHHVSLYPLPAEIRRPKEMGLLDFDRHSCIFGKLCHL